MSPARYIINLDHFPQHSIAGYIQHLTRYSRLSTQHLEGLVPGVYISRIWSTTVSSENNTAFVPTGHVGPGGITDMGAARQFTERFGIVSSGGTNCTLTEIAPGAKVPMVRNYLGFLGLVFLIVIELL